MGHNNNRWRGIRRWENGDVWALQTHHLIELLVPENTPLKAEEPYATTAGVHVGSHQHTHFEFKIGRARDPQRPGRPGGEAEAPASIAQPVDFDDESQLAQTRPEVLHLDPWIVFRQIFEDRKARRGAIRAAIGPCSPAETGRPVTFSAAGSRPAGGASRLQCYWTFGDGGFARGTTAAHVFAAPGVYPVTLVVDDGAHRATTTQHVTLGGDPVQQPVLVLAAPDEPAFRRRPVRAMDVYGSPVGFIPHTLEFVARSSRPVPRSKHVRLENLGGGELPVADSEIEVEGEKGWLEVLCRGDGNRQSLGVAVDAAGLPPGTYAARVRLSCAGVLNSPQSFRVRLRVMSELAAGEVTVDDGDPGFFATPYFWVGHRFCRCPSDKRGYGGFYLTNGGRPAAGEFARFTPDLSAGRYEVSLSGQTPFVPGTEFDVRVRHRGGEQSVRVEPARSRTIGTFEFDEGSDGFVELRAEGAKGLVMADAVTFAPR